MNGIGIQDCPDATKIIELAEQLRDSYGNSEHSNRLLSAESHEAMSADHECFESDDEASNP